jgi:Glutathione S-transferase, C-terminal domain
MLDHHGSAFFSQTRETWFGKKLEELNPKCWQALESGLD